MVESLRLATVKAMEMHGGDETRMNKLIGRMLVYYYYEA